MLEQGGGSDCELEPLRQENRQLQLDLQNAKSKNSMLKQKLNLSEEKNIALETRLAKLPNVLSLSLLFFLNSLSSSDL